MKMAPEIAKGLLWGKFSQAENHHLEKSCLEMTQVSFGSYNSFVIIATRRIKYLGVYLPKETKDIYIETIKH